MNMYLPFVEWQKVKRGNMSVITKSGQKGKEINNHKTDKIMA